MEIPRKIGYKVLSESACIIASPCLLWAVVISSANTKIPLSVIIYDSRGSADNKIFEFITWYWQMTSFTPAVPIPAINGLYIEVPPDTVVCVYYEPMYTEKKVKAHMIEFEEKYQ